MKKLFILSIPLSILISCNSLSERDEWALAYSTYNVEKNGTSYSYGCPDQFEAFNIFKKKQWDYKTKTAYSSLDEKSYQIKYSKNIRTFNKAMFLRYYNLSKCHFNEWKDEFVNQNNTEKAYHLSLAKEFLDNALDIYNNDKKFLECENCEEELVWISAIKDFKNYLKQY